MDTWEQVGRRIRLPKLTHQNRKYIVARHGVKPQMLNIRNKRRNHQKISIPVHRKTAHLS